MAHVPAAQPGLQRSMTFSEASLDFTVVICTYNGAQRLPAVLACLQQQVTPAQLRWEILIIDNNSSDHTASLVHSYQHTWQGPGSIRYGFEPQQGASFARQRAVRLAHSELIGFLDDDNLPDPHWVAAAYAFGQQHPQAGAYGSQIYGQFEAPPPQNFSRIRSFFALTQRGPTPHRYERRQRVLPPGAGLVVRKQAWLETVPTQCILSGPTPTQRLAGEDLEAVSYIQLSRWEIWYNPAMTLRHAIPAERLQRHYLMPFFRSIGLSRYVTRMLSVSPWQRPLILPCYLLSDTVKILGHLLRYRRRIDEDLVAACELQLFLWSLISPFYLGRRFICSRIFPGHPYRSGMP